MSFPYPHICLVCVGGLLNNFSMGHFSQACVVSRWFWRTEGTFIYPLRRGVATLARCGFPRALPIRPYPFCFCITRYPPAAHIPRARARAHARRVLLPSPTSMATYACTLRTARIFRTRFAHCAHTHTFHFLSLVGIWRARARTCIISKTYILC